MKKTNLLWMLVWTMVLLLASCQKVVVDELKETKETGGGISLQFNVARFEQIPFETIVRSRATDIKEVCTRIQLAVYKGATKVKQLNQTSDDPDFGKFSVSLNAGTYKIVVLAHSGAKNATMTDMQKITFDGKVTDTFYYSEDITVSEDMAYSLALKRAVAMFRLIVTDAVPAQVAYMRFYYTGGSSTFDAVRGVGCVDSRQSEKVMVVPEARTEQSVYEVYTFPRADSRALKMQVTAHDSGDNVYLQKIFENVQIERNKISQYTGNFFGGTPIGGEEEANALSFTIYSEDEWIQEDHTY